MSDIIKLAFYKASHGNILDKIVAWWTRPCYWKVWESSQYSHVEIIVDSTLCIGASPRENGVRLKSINDLYISDKWDIVEVEVDKKYTILDGIYSELGKEYDWLCIFFSHIVKVGIQEKKRWTCSELAAEKVLGIHENAHKINPSELYNILLTQRKTY